MDPIIQKLIVLLESVAGRKLTVDERVLAEDVVMDILANAQSKEEDIAYPDDDMPY